MYSHRTRLMRHEKKSYWKHRSYDNYLSVFTAKKWCDHGYDLYTNCVAVDTRLHTDASFVPTGFISFFYLHDKCPKIILMMSLSQSVSNKNANIEIPSRFPNTEAAIVQTLKCLNLIKQNSIELTCSWLYIKKKNTWWQQCLYENATPAKRKCTENIIADHSSRSLVSMVSETNYATIAPIR